MTIWSRWFRKEPTPPFEESPPPRAIMVGERLNRDAVAASSVAPDRCPLCDGAASHAGRPHVRIECDACGVYFISMEAVQTLNALVTYRQRASMALQQVLVAHRQRAPEGMPMISVQYAVAPDVPTFEFSIL